MGHLNNISGDRWGGHIGHKAAEVGARIAMVGTDIMSSLKQAVGPLVPKKIVSKGGKVYKEDTGEKGSKFLANVMPMMALLANLTAKPKSKEDKEPIRKWLQLEHTDSSARINPMILMDRGG